MFVKLFCLPHPKLYHLGIRALTATPGFMIKCFLQGNESNTRIPCALMMVEIAIWKQLDFDRSADKCLGYDDMGCL